MKVKELRHIRLFEALSPDQDEEDVASVSNLPYFDLIVKLALNDVEPLDQHAQQEKEVESGAFSWSELERALGTCAYLGTDSVAKTLVAQSLWSKTRLQLEPILDFHTGTWKKQGGHKFLNEYLSLYFEISRDESGKIHTATRVKHCWTDPEIHPIPITTRNAAGCGNMKTLVHLRATGSSWSADTCDSAARNGHLECLTYAHDNGWPWDEYTCAWAARNGHLPCLTYAHENGCPWDASTCSRAAENGHLLCLMYAHENGCAWNSATCSSASQNCHLLCLTYAHKNGCWWDEGTCMWAACNGHLECLIYAHENGCPWDIYTCAGAAQSGHLHCLVYAHENGCPWNALTCAWACSNGHLDCLTYAKENGCPFDALLEH